MIIPSSESKVLLIGNGMKSLVKNTSVDSLKNLMITDVNNARKQASYPASAKVTHYFVSPNGKRRLKTESEDYTEPAVNVEIEKRSLALDLPPYEYIIYAIQYNYECHIYLKNPGDLEKLMAVNFSEALASIKEEKKVIRQSTRIDLEKDQAQWKIQNHSGNKLNLLEWTPSFGLSLIGGRWSPAVGFDLSIIFNDKFRSPMIKTGLSYTMNTFAEWSHNEFTTLSAVSSYDFRFLTNMGGAKPKWVGLQGGFMKAADNKGSLNNKFKLGVVSEGFSVFNFSFDIIFLKKNDGLLSLTLKLPF
jgi:hypothetical protein